MNLENQFVNLELSKKLKELGVKQESLFYWYYCDENKPFIEYEELLYENIYRTGPDPIKICSAFTASELLEMLPFGEFGYNFLLIQKDDEYDISHAIEDAYIENNIHFLDKNLQNALAKMIIHLIEKQLIEI